MRSTMRSVASLRTARSSLSRATAARHTLGTAVPRLSHSGSNRTGSVPTERGASMCVGCTLPWGAPAAGYESPRGHFLSPLMLLYNLIKKVADEYNHIIRRILANGTVVLAAGTPSTLGYSGDRGPATLAKLNLPHGLVEDGSGGAYIAGESCSGRGVSSLDTMSRTICLPSRCIAQIPTRTLSGDFLQMAPSQPSLATGLHSCLETAGPHRWRP